MLETTAAVILAAGAGTRMKSSRAKVLHEVLGRPLVHFPVLLARELGLFRTIAVVGHAREAVEACIRQADPAALFAVQANQRGTADAVAAAEEESRGASHVLILSGDVPGLSAPTVIEMVRLLTSHPEAAMVALTFETGDPTGYGRCVVEDGALLRIVEHKDATEAQRQITTVNAGVYLAQRDFLYQTLASVDSNNAQGEFYLTDVAHLAAAAGRAGRALVVPETEVEGINDKVQLAEMERRTRQARNEELMRSGVTMLDPARVTVGFDCTVGRDVVLHPDVSLSGKTTVGEDTVISTGCVLTDAHLGSGVLLKPYSVLTNAVVGDECQVGPFAHLRPGTRLGTKAKIGNFVETKKAVFGQGSKASHLSYLGDCVLGRDVNIGAGTITCNYDGLDKHKTIIGDRVFIGSNSSIVAPCNIGEEALVAAGTTVTVDTIQPGALALNEGRRQVEKSEWSFKVGPWARRRRRDANKKA